MKKIFAALIVAVASAPAQAWNEQDQRALATVAGVALIAAATGQPLTVGVAQPLYYTPRVADPVYYVPQPRHYYQQNYYAPQTQYTYSYAPVTRCRVRPLYDHHGRVVGQREFCRSY